MPAINISNATITDISSDRNTTYVTVTYQDGPRGRRNDQTLRLVVGPRTVILNTNNFPVSASALRIGMVINASVSSAMTRSIPPQAAALLIRIVRRQQSNTITIGRILEIDRRSKSFTTISDRDPSSIIRFNPPENTRILNRRGRPMDFSDFVAKKLRKQ